IGGELLIINQAGVSTSCSYSLSPTFQIFTGAGGTGGSFTVTAPSACSWTASTAATWITFNSRSGTGNGTVTFSVAANTGEVRGTGITVGDRTFSVTQFSSCDFSLNSNSQSFGAGGGTGSTAVTVSGNCNWTAVALDPWVTVTSGANYTGSKTVTF